MRNFLIGLALSLVLLLGIVLVAPSFVDWNQYRDQLTAQVEGATGRALTIEGDLSLSILPMPALSADGVTLANMDGGSNPTMARIDGVRVNVDIVPLLRGDIVVTSVEIIRPDILLERLADGRANWELTVGGSGTGQVGGAMPKEPTSGGESGDVTGSGGGLAVSIDRIQIVDGTLRYRDAQSGASEDVTDINLELAAQSLTGPFSARGGLTPHGVPLTIQAAIGALAGDKAAQVALRVALDNGDDEGTGPASIEFNGLLSDLAGNPVLRGDLAIAAADPAAAVAVADTVLGQSLTLPPPLTRPMSLKGKLQASAIGASLKDLDISAADTQATGQMNVDLGAVPKVDLSLIFTKVDLDGWVQAALAPTAPPAIRKAEGGDSVPSLVSAAHAQTSAGDAAGAKAESPTAFSLPTGFDLAVDVSAEAATYNGSALRDLRLNAVLSEGEVTVNELSARLPGASDLSAFGFVRGGDQGPALDMTLKAASGDLRALLDWLRVDLASVPGDRLRALNLQANLVGSPSLIKVTGLDMTLDTTRAKGAFTVRPGDRLGIGATLRVDALNADAYMPPAAKAGAEAKTALPSPPPGGKGDGDVDPTATKTAKAGVEEPALLAGLEVLNTLDASFDVAIGRLTLQGEEYVGLTAKGALVNGMLTLTEAGMKNGLGGLRASLSGGIGGFGGVPKLKDFSYDVRAADPAKVARGLRITLPVPAEELGSVALLGTLSGTPNALTVDSRVVAARANVQVKGKVTGAMGATPTLDLDTALKHPNLVALARLVQPDYAPKGKPGAIDVTAHLSGGLDKITVSNLGGTLGKTTLSGSVTVVPGLGVPKVVADLTLGDLDLDDFLPAQKTAAVTGGDNAVRKASLSGRGWGGVPRPGPGEMFQRAAAVVLAPDAVERRRLETELASAPWSSDPIDLSALDGLDADIALKAKSLSHDGWTLQNADIKAVARDSVVDLSRLNGSLFGGKLTGSGKVVGGASPTYDMQLGLSRLQVAKYLALFGGVAGAKGQGDLSLALNSKGLTALDLVRALGGKGGVDLKGLDLQAGSLKGQGLAELFELVGILNQAASLGMKSGGLADLSGSFSIDKGVVSFDPFSLVSQLYRGTLSGTVDLANWTVDASGSAKLAESAVSSLLGKAVKLPDTIPFSLAGGIDNPVIKVATASLPKANGKGLVDQVAPDAGKALDKVIPGAGDLLNGVLGGKTEPKATKTDKKTTAKDDAKAKAKEEKAKTKAKEEKPAEQLIRGLLNGLGG
jgi:uncharacterized protein involved in outer membrane biogenesis